MGGRGTCLLMVACAFVGIAGARAAMAQPFGSELHNTLTPGAGAMAGASIAAPQDVAAALNGNPATLAQLGGTQFIFGSAWAEGTYNASYDGSVPALNLLGLSTFSAKSMAQGSAIPNIGVTYALDGFGRPITVGMGLLPVAGLAVDFRHVPGSGGVSAEYLNLGTASVVGVQLTDRLSLGASGQVGYAVFEGGFVETSSASADYAMRGTVGLNYNVLTSTIVGAYYQTKESFTFDNAILLAGTFRDIHMSQPENVGLGVANTALMEGQLLLAADFLYKNWSNAAFWRAVYKDQFVVQLGAQLTIGRARWRCGYAYNTNPMRTGVGDDIGGVVLTALARGVEYLQATTATVASQHRITGGIGIAEVLPNTDADLMAGGMFKGTQTYGGHSTGSVESYWLGFGLTWRYNQPGVAR